MGCHRIQAAEGDAKRPLEGGVEAPAAKKPETESAQAGKDADKAAETDSEEESGSGEESESEDDSDEDSDEVWKCISDMPLNTAVVPYAAWQAMLSSCESKTMILFHPAGILWCMHTHAPFRSCRQAQLLSQVWFWPCLLL